MSPTLGALRVFLAALVVFPATAGFAANPDSVIDWMQGPPDRDGHAAYTAVHAETRIKEFNPQVPQSNSALSAATTWQSLTPDVQPFRSIVDRGRNAVYWRKDFFDACNASSACTFYGEVFGYNDQSVYLRTESFPVFGEAIDDGKTWDIRIDKFREFVNSNQGLDQFPFGIGRIWAPRLVVDGWSTRQIINTYACLSRDEFTYGQCRPYQRNFVDDSVTLEVWTNFSTVFDGEVAGYSADPEYKHFDRAIVISQVMGNGQSRERFFLGGKRDQQTKRFENYGFVRWDDSIRNASGSFVVVARTVGLRREITKEVTFDGMETRGAWDSFIGEAGVRVLHDDGSVYPDVNQSKACPGAFRSIGSVHVPRTAGGELHDMSGFSTTSGGWVGICHVPDDRVAELTLPDGCPVTQQRGSLYVTDAYAKRTLAETGTTLARVLGGWVVLCVGDANDWSTYLSLRQVGCDSGGFDAGTIGTYEDCYDAKGRRCKMRQDTMILCAAR